eukprot:1233736-Rhodomonas_salina.6
MQVEPTDEPGALRLTVQPSKLGVRATQNLELRLRVNHASAETGASETANQRIRLPLHKGARAGAQAPPEGYRWGADGRAERAARVEDYVRGYGLALGGGASVLSRKVPGGLLACAVQKLARWLILSAASGSVGGEQAAEGGREAGSALAALLHATLSSRSPELFETCVGLVAQGASHSLRTAVVWEAGEQGSALVHAAGLGQHAMMTRLLQMLPGYAPSAAAQQRVCAAALHAAVESGEVEAAELVLGASGRQLPLVDVQDSAGRTALWLALASNVERWDE